MLYAELLLFVREHNIELDIRPPTRRIYKDDLVPAVSRYYEECVVSEVQQLANAQRHQVLFTPPYNSDLEPIELVWAQVKGRVRRAYHDGKSCGLCEDMFHIICFLFVFFSFDAQDARLRAWEKSWIAHYVRCLRVTWKGFSSILSV